MYRVNLFSSLHKETHKKYPTIARIFELFLNSRIVQLYYIIIIIIFQIL